MNTGAPASELFGIASPVVLAAMERGCALRTAAGIAGVSPPLVCKWVRNGELDPDGIYGPFAVRVRQIQAGHVEEAEQAHKRVRDEGNHAAIQWYLARMDRETYGDDAAKAPVQAPEEPLPDASPEDVRRAIKGEP